MKFTPTVVWRMRTWPSPGLPSGMSSSLRFSAPPTSRTTTALTMWELQSVLGRGCGAFQGEKRNLGLAAAFARIAAKPARGGDAVTRDNDGNAVRSARGADCPRRRAVDAGGEIAVGGRLAIRD